MPEEYPYRIVGRYVGKSLVFCGAAGRWWFSERKPTLCAVEFSSPLVARDVIKEIVSGDNDFCVIDGSSVGYCRVHPRLLTLSVEP